MVGAASGSYDVHSISAALRNIYQSTLVEVMVAVEDVFVVVVAKVVVVKLEFIVTIPDQYSTPLKPPQIAIPRLQLSTQVLAQMLLERTR